MRAQYEVFAGSRGFTGRWLWLARLKRWLATGTWVSAFDVVFWCVWWHIAVIAVLKRCA